MDEYDGMDGWMDGYSNRHKIIASHGQMKTKVLNDSFEIPSLEQIEQMERQRSQGVESLEIYAAVKYQRCGMAIHIVGNYLGPHNDRVAKKDKVDGKLLSWCKY